MRFYKIKIRQLITFRTKLKVNFHNRRIYIILALILILLLAYIFFKVSSGKADSFGKFLSCITNPYLLFIEKFANIILRWTGTSLSIQNNGIYNNGLLIDSLTTQIIFKKATVFYILILWFTRTTAWKKIYFTGIYLVLSFLSSSIYLVAETYSIAGDFNYTSIISTTHSVLFICMNTTLLFWYLINKNSRPDSPSNISVIAKLTERKLLDIIIILYGYSIVIILLGYFNFRLYIDILLKSSKGILGLLGYDSVIEPFLLTGNNGSIFVHSSCLGFMTMFLFAALVYLTGNKNKRGWGYIIFGLLLLNLLNILRIVLLFIHIQKHGDYVLAMDVHDLYNYVIYFIVFVLWIIWFERLMDLKTIKSIKSFFKK